MAFDTELVSNVILELKPEIAPDTNGLTAESILRTRELTHFPFPFISRPFPISPL